MDAFDIVRCHALSSAGDGYWVVPATASFPRSAPLGASLAREDGDLVLRSDGSGDGSITTISSGWRTNDELLLSEGWADESLQCDRVEMSEATLRRAADDVLGVTPPEKARQGAILEGLRTLGYLPPTTAELGGAVLAGGLVSDELGRHLQALSVTNVELGMFGEAGCVINIGEGVPLSCEHEERVGRVLCAACDSLLAGFATPLHADEEALEAEPEGDHASRRLQLSIRSRLSRKRCLAACRASAAAWVERPTATGTLRRPWKVNIKTSG